jgi:hypothetical protein
MNTIPNSILFYPVILSNLLLPSSVFSVSSVANPRFTSGQWVRR